MLSISPEDISVVVQGPLYLGGASSVHDCVESINRCLPGAEIVVSTWHSEPDLALTGVTMVRSDPIAPMIDVNGKPINTRRQRVSTLRGLQAASRPFVLKFRADHQLLDARITQLHRYEGVPRARDRLFMAPITTTTMFFRDPCAAPFLFHPSDLVQFGRRDDLLEFWSAPPIPVEEYFLPHPTVNPFGNCARPTARRYVPEQELMIAFLRTRGHEVALTGVCHLNPRLMHLSESLLLANFHALDWRDAGIEFPPRMKRRACRSATDYSTESIVRAKRLFATRRYALRIARALTNKYVFSMFSKRWWRRAAEVIYLRYPPKLAARRARNLIRYGLKPSDLTPLNTPSWRRAEWPSMGYPSFKATEIVSAPRHSRGDPNTSTRQP